MRPTILYAVVLLALSARLAHAQSPPGGGDPFAAGRWHFEAEGIAAVEAWNYNISHEEIYGLGEAITYGIGNGLVLRAGQRFAYVSQRSEDAILLALTIGVRGRVYQRGRLSAFLQGDVGLSHTAVAAPPRGTRFNYLAAGGAGVTIGIRPRLHLVATLQMIHISNAGVKGPGRNPDIEAIGPSLGMIVGF
jgi:hypothetical protein